MTTASTQGKKVSYDVQASFGTPNVAGLTDVRLEGDPTIEPAIGVGVQPSEMGANPFHVAKPIVNNQASDSAVVVTSLPHQALTAGNDSFAKTAFESGGYNVVSSNDTTSVGAETATVTLVDAGTYDIGYGANVELADGSFVPTLFGYTDGGFQFTPTMALPSSTAASLGEVNKALTITPNVLTEVSGDKLLTFLSGTNVGTVQAQDCALTSVGDIVFNANELIPIEYTFGASNKTRGDVATTHSNTFADGSESIVTYQPWCQLSATSTDWSTALSASYAKIISATVTLGITAEQMIGMGDANCINNIQGWMQKGVPAKIVLDMLYDSDKIDDFDGTNPEKYLAIIQPGQSRNDPSMGFFAPVAHQDVEGTTVDYIGNNEHRVTVTYTVNPSAMDGTTDSDLGNQPWYLVFGDKSA